ncbi:class I SAM-dependent methyltransferase [Saccharothrix obliqua]|uniref:class I SAM-dependent methyltransferase n=1 Tax=Saccharothrix obliqua TaxID=2861747 RepID=UPI001C607FFA|nr:class I SAM-dependent methyltransferase [Saccharothrix obliqua]MBW4721859.1 class I SAM-dependent methyltransferase [Saccharothrix obliqua]
MTPITNCRVCGNRELIPVLDLGEQAVTSVFPESPDQPVPVVPLELVKCGPDGCGLAQLRHSTDVDLMYGTGSYGYRSSIRPYMVDHLGRQVERITEVVDLAPGDLVLDIGSNDATMLRAFPRRGLELVGIDPNGEQFRAQYPPGIELVTDYFSKDVFTARFGDRRKAKVVTSIAMFYDLPSPLETMRDIYDVLDEDGVWVSEQSYLPAMLAKGAYDVVCHEHLEYYALRQFEWMAEQVGFTVVRAEITPVYGGSLNLVMAKNGRRHRPDRGGVEAIRRAEADLGLDGMRPFTAFADRSTRLREELREFLDRSRAAGKLTLGYGASTKGNVILQFCGVTPADLPCVGEVNEDKSGRFTPGTGIPIVSEQEAHARKPDQLLVLPWVHRDDFLGREQHFLDRGGRMVFPLPDLTVVDADNGRVPATETN